MVDKVENAVRKAAFVTCSVFVRAPPSPRVRLNGIETIVLARTHDIPGNRSAISATVAGIAKSSPSLSYKAYGEYVSLRCAPTYALVTVDGKFHDLE